MGGNWREEVGNVLTSEKNLLYVIAQWVNIFLESTKFLVLPSKTDSIRINFLMQEKEFYIEGIYTVTKNKFLRELESISWK